MDKIKKILNDQLENIASSSGSYFDPELSEDKLDEIKEVSGKDIVDQLRGKKKFSPEEIENLKKARKLNSFLP
jgi:hypothetical protein